MTVRESVQLSSLTTFKLGGPARYLIGCENEADLKEAVAFAAERNLPWYAIGEGSNILASDSGYPGVLIRYAASRVSFDDAGDAMTLTADAGMIWDDLVKAASERELWGIENLAGIPGTAGAAPVQNIGAYGAELADTLLGVRAFDAKTDEVRELTKDECQLGYRESRFKRDASLIITQITLTLSKTPTPKLSYKDLAARTSGGEALDTPGKIGDAVRSIRSKKFPDLTLLGTAGSFFKNPIITAESYAKLKAEYPEIPGFTSPSGTKVPLAWILDSALALRGFSVGNVRLFEAQPLVIVAEQGARTRDVDTLAATVEKKVFDATGITLTREVRSLG